MANSTPIIPPIRGVLFDLDNTLYDRDYAFSMWARGCIERHFAAENPERRDTILQEWLTWDAGGHTTRAVLFAQILAHYPALPVDAETLNAQFATEWLEHMMLEEDTERLLDRLDATGMPYGIVTNGTAYQNVKIRHLALEHRVRCLFVSGEFGCHKPDPAIFRAAAACLDLPCEQILFVGDNPEADIGGARSVGMQTAWIHRGKPWPAALADIQPDYIITSLGELLPVLKPA